MKQEKERFLEQAKAIFRPFAGRIMIAFCFIAFSQALGLSGPYIQGKLIDELASKNSLETTYWLIALAGMVAFVNVWVSGYYRDCFEIKEIDFDVDTKASSETLAKLSNLSIGQHNAQNSGLKQSIINRGQHSLTALVFTGLYDLLPTVGRILIVGGAMLWMDLLMGIIVFVTIILAGGLSIYINNRFQKDMKSLEKNWNEESKFRTEIIRNMSHVISNAQEDRAQKEAGQKLAEVNSSAKSVWIRFIAWAHSRNTLTVAARIIIMVVGANYVYSGKYTLGSLMIFWSWSNEAFSSIQNIGHMQRRIMQMWSSIRQYLEFLGVESDVKIPENPVVLDSLSGEIEFQNVTFEYPSRRLISKDEEDDEDDEEEKSPKEAPPEKRPALSGVSFSIKQGEVVAVVGESGSGKTTLAGLLLRASDPTSGNILIDGHDLKAIDLNHFRKRVGLVEQTVPLFDRSIRDNILYGLDREEQKIGEEELKQVAEASQISRFFDRLEEGFDTVIGEKGIKLSGGERQRVGIARALIKNPAILVFDEATSSLDAAVEAEVRDAIQKACVGRTAIIIAHRFSTIRHATRVIVMDKGRVVGDGTHEELRNSCEAYQRLLKHQELSVLVEEEQSV